MNYFLKQRKTFVSFVIILNSTHLFIRFGEENINFNPILGCVVLFILLFISIKLNTYSIDSGYLSIIFLTFGFQVIGYLVSDFKVYDYINLFVIKANIPDLIIFFTLLTYGINKAKSYIIKN